MIRAAAKNFAFAAVGRLARELRRGAAGAATRPSGRLSLATRESLAAEAFAYTARYDTAIARWFAEKQRRLPAAVACAPTRRSPTSPTARTRTSAPPTTAQVGARMHVLSMVRQLGGKELSFNNLLDLNAGAAARAASSSSRPARSSSTTTRAACAVGDSALEAYQRAFACDPLSRVRRRHLPQPAGRRARSPRRSSQQFVEVLFAPGFTDEALEILAGQAEPAHPRGRRAAARQHRRARPQAGRSAALLVQDRDIDLEDRAEMEVVTERKPTERRVGRDAVRLEGLQARALERDRARAGPAPRSASAPAR